METRVLLLGGHGKIALSLTPRLLSRSWNVTSVIRNRDQTDEILRKGIGQPGKVSVLVSSLDDISRESEAGRILDDVRPDYVVWAAGAGGKGGAARTYAVDRDAAIAFIRASIARPFVKKYLLISFVTSRRGRAPWWNDADWESAQKTNTQVLPDYYKAKLAADECLTVLARRRRRSGGDHFQDIILRPGTLSDDQGTGRVSLGKTGVSGGYVAREDVAQVAAMALANPDLSGWIDCQGGNKSIEAEIDRIVKHKVDAVEGEDFEAMENSVL